MRITYSIYKPAPESCRVSVNGHPLNVSKTRIPVLLATGQTSEALQEIKRTYRKAIKQENRYIFAFFRENSKQFYYIACLNFSGSADLQTRLYNYKELKHHLQNHPQTITTESGHVSPARIEKPETKTETVQIDFTKCRRIRISA